MTRARRAEDWERDREGARASERLVAERLARDARITELRDFTDAYDALDFGFTYEGEPVAVDVKEKLQRYSRGVQELWQRVPERNLFIVDETVFRRIVWQGGGGYLAVHDAPGERWVTFGPWDLTLGVRMRYGRWGQRFAAPFLKGKLLLDLSTGSHESRRFEVELLLRTIREARNWRDRVEPYPIHGARLRELGRPDA